MSKPRIGIAGLLHESNTFVSGVTTRQDFIDTSLDVGDRVLDRWRGTHHEVGGFLDGAELEGLEPVPILVAVAIPGGPLTAATFDGLLDGMMRGMRDAGPLDGLLLALHGATVAMNHPDADGRIAGSLRQLVGPDLPIVMTLDLHANVSDRMIESTNATVFYRTTPHVDQRQRGLDAARIMARTVRGEIRPVQALERLPLIMSVLKHDVSEAPAADVLTDTEQVCRRPGILAASVGYSYPWADVAEMGCSVVTVADGDESVAADAARWLAGRTWNRRHEFVCELPTVREAVRQAAADDDHPVVVSDVGDNVGGGAPGDSTVLFHEVLRQEVPNTLVTLFDPEAVRHCASCGVGADVQLSVGGKTDDRHGTPLPIQGRVRTLSDGYFHEPQPRHGGRSDNHQGLTAVVETPQQHTVVLTSLRMAPLSLHQVLSLGIDPVRKKLILVKAVIAPRPAYAPIAARFLLADTPGATSADFTQLPYKHRRRPMFPFEPEARYEANP
jgi:microcystin degradation protein MlrC